MCETALCTGTYCQPRSDPAGESYDRIAEALGRPRNEASALSHLASTEMRLSPFASRCGGRRAASGVRVAAIASKAGAIRIKAETQGSDPPFRPFATIRKASLDKSDCRLSASIVCASSHRSNSDGSNRMTGIAIMNDPETVLEEFCVLCDQMWIDRDVFGSLFEDDPKGRDLCRETFPYLFNDINRLMVENLFLQFCRITDPSGTGSKLNLTTNYIVTCLPWSKQVKAQLEAINAELMAFRAKIEKARSKRIAHVDLDAQVSRAPAMGGFQPGEDFKFLRDLQQFVNVAYGQLHNGHIRPIRPAVSSDAYRLIRALEKAALYDRCYRCSETDRNADLLDFQGRS